MEGTALDPLAGLHDREGFDHLLVREELRRGRTDETMVVAFVGIDGFADVEERYGAGTAASLVSLCADALRRTLRAVDELARTADDEFAVLLHATDFPNAGLWATRFEALADRAGIGHRAGRLRCSVGIADTVEAGTVLEAATLARQRMEAIQAARDAQRPPGDQPFEDPPSAG